MEIPKQMQLRGKGEDRAGEQKTKGEEKITAFYFVGAGLFEREQSGGFEVPFITCRLEPLASKTAPQAQKNCFDKAEVKGLSGGILVATRLHSAVVEWLSLATNELVLRQLELHGLGHIQELALAIPEEDLLAVLLTSKPLSENDGTVKLCFYKMSTQSAHRMAREPVIQVSIPMGRILNFEMDICGSKIALLVTYPAGVMSLVLIYDWKEGRLLLEIPGSHSAVTFLSPDVLLLVQIPTGTLELWTIQDNVPEGTVGPEMSLKLPRLANPTHMYAIFGADANPKGRGSPSSQEPFDSSFIDSIVVFQLFILGDDDNGSGAEMFLVLSRRALLQLLPPDEKEVSWREWGPPICHWLEKNATNTWSPTVCGQRFAFAGPSLRNIRLLDFNPYTHSKLARNQRDATGEEPTVCTASGENIQMVGDLTSALFGEEVCSQLGCVVADFPAETDYNAVSIDGKWIVGIKDTSDADRKVSFDVWHLE
ncbi:hypothetical protein B0H16DRAFT_1685498 [Mycena metata]|uniref:Uncharacterized protein n=1 Tax=Mycena metata TaxID=1033252 RepID=A0AAD7JVX2_9AGAR|nr:hypothetical protein B0H16DRAFT_1685498 [Mycena metata]